MSDKYPGGFVTANAPAGFSVNFNGSSGFSYSGTTFGSGAWTAELWFYFTGTSFTGPIQFFEGTTNSLVLAIMSSTTIRVDQVNVSNDLYTVPTMSANTWYHVAATKDASGNQTLFLNGVRSSTGVTTTSRNFSAATTRVAYSTIGGTNFTGYYSNLRFVTGTAVYNPLSTTINVPTQLFPISGTQLLICQSPTAIDNSSNAYTLTASGTPTVSNFTPFAAYQGFNPALGAAAGGVWTLDEAAYYQNNRQWPIYDPYFNQTTLMLHGNGTNAAQNNTFLDSSTNNFTITRNGNTAQGTFSPFSQTGWSNFFSSSANYLTVPYNANFTWSTGARTYEAWVYVTSVAANNAIFAISDLSTSNGFELYINTSSQVVFRYFTTVPQVTTTTGTVPLNTWTHVAFVYDGTSNFTIYINGVSSATGTKTGSPVTPTAQLCIGRTNIGSAGDVFFSGYISNARFTTTTVYTSNFTPSNAPLTAITGTSLLTCQDNRFVDDSANKATITANGTVSVQAFSPFVPAYITPTTYSNWFNGSTGYLTTPNSSAFAFGTGDFTVEFWMATTDTAGGAGQITGGTTGYWQVGLSGSQIVWQNSRDTSNLILLNISSYLNNSFNHFAFVRSGTTMTLYINGVSSATATDTTNYNGTAGALLIGQASDGNYFAGCLSNYRIVKGTAVYTANFTPPTAPLTAISGTSLLTCQSSTIVDNSASPNTLTVTGAVYPVTSPTPFPAKVDTTTLNSAYSTSLIGGSYYGDGTGDYVRTPTDVAFALGTSDFTFETWLYPTVAGNDSVVIDNRNPSGGIQGFAVSWATGSVIRVIVGAPNAWDVDQSTAAVGANSWIHYALTRSGTTFRIFLNGALVYTSGAISGSMGTTAVYATVGAAYNGAQPFTGYFSGTRLIKGTCLYTSSFAPPLAPLTPVTNTSVLLNYTNAGIIDNTAKNVLETVGNAQISTAQSKYGGSSMYFDGTGDSLKGKLNNAMGGGDYTIECWIYTGASSARYIFDMRETSQYLGAFTVGTTLYVNIGTTLDIVATTSYPQNAWNHFVMVRSGSGSNNTSIYLNGSRILQVTDTTNYSIIPTLYIGNDNTGSYSWNGYIDDLRITKGVARYVTNFTPPTSQLQDQ